MVVSFCLEAYFLLFKRANMLCICCVLLVELGLVFYPFITHFLPRFVVVETDFGIQAILLQRLLEPVRPVYCYLVGYRYRD